MNVLSAFFAGFLLSANFSLAVAVSGEEPREEGGDHSAAREIRDVSAAGLGTFEISLAPVRVWTGDAVVALNYGDRIEERQPENLKRWAGRIVGRADSRVLLTELPDGQVRGLMSLGSHYWILPATPPQSALDFQAVDSDHPELRRRGESFECGVDSLPQERPLTEAMTAAQPAFRGVTATRSAHDYTARVALETDAALLDHFDSISDAVTYIGDIFAFISGIYEDETSTTLVLNYLSLWPEGDPWQHDTILCGLFETGGHWNTHHQDVDRSIMHYLSGRSLGGGVAYLGALCAGSFAPNVSACSNLPPVPGNQYGGAYGASGSISGAFDPANPGVVWDLVVIAHEIGHNFNSPHTHCYGGIGGNPVPVDRCFGGEGSPPQCHQGGGELPGAPGTGSGTIMSYCHTLQGGIANMGATFGAGHPYGAAPDRVPAHMHNYVGNLANQAPACLAPADGYQLSVSPVEAEVCLIAGDGGSARFDVLVYAAGELAEPVELELGSMPPGITGGFSPATVDAPGASVLTVDVEPGTDNGDYEVEILAFSGDLQAGITMNLEVTSGQTPDCENPFPVADIFPLSFTFEVNAGNAAGGVLNIGNSGPEADLEWSLESGAAAPGMGPSVCDDLAQAGWLSVSPDQGTTVPGGNEPVDVTVDAGELSVGDHAGVLCVTTDDPELPRLEIPVELSVTPAPAILEADPGELDFGQVYAGETTTLDFGVLNAAEAGALALTLKTIGIDGNGFYITGGNCETGTELEPGANCAIEAGFTPDAIGEFNGEVGIEAGDGSTVVVTLRGVGAQPAILHVDPGELSFGEIFAGNTATLAFDVFNAAEEGALALELTIIEINGGGFDIAGGDCAVGTELEPGAGCSIEAGFTPGAVGEFNGGVSIGTAGGDTMVVMLHGTGVEPVEEVFEDRFEYAARCLLGSSALYYEASEPYTCMHGLNIDSIGKRQ